MEGLRIFGEYNLCMYMLVIVIMHITVINFGNFL